MAGRVQRFGRGKLNYLIHNEVMPTIAEELDPPLDTLPMDRENYDFYRRGLSLLRGMSRLQGGELYDTTDVVIEKLIHRTPKLPKGQTEYSEEQKDPANKAQFRGPLYGYQAYLDRNGLNPDEFTFDRFFVMCFKRMARNEVESSYKTLRSRTPHLSTSGAGHFKEEEGFGAAVSEGTLEDPTSPAPSSRVEQEENRYALDELMPDLIVKEMLAKGRNAKPLLLFYQMFFKDGAKFLEIGEHLDQLAESDSDYWPAEGGVDREGNKVPWSLGTLDRYKDTIMGIAERYNRRKEWERKRAITPQQQRAIFQSRRV